MQNLSDFTSPVKENLTILRAAFHNNNHPKDCRRLHSSTINKTLMASSIRYKPLYLQVREKLLARIDTGNYRSGDTIPSESVLAEEFGTSISTIRQAISMLADDGLLIKKQGKGTYVSEQKTHLRLATCLDTIDPVERELIRQTVSEAIGTFQNQYSSLAVEYEFTDKEELLHRITSGNAPDILHFPSYWTSYFASLGACIPLEGLLPARLSEQQRVYGGCCRDTLYAVAWGRCPISLFVNKQILQQANIKLPELPMSLDDFSAVCQTLDDFYKGHGISSYGVSVSDNRAADFFSLYSFLQAFGGGFLAGHGKQMIDSPEDAAAFRWLRQFIRTRRVYRADMPTIRQRFAQGKIAFISDSSRLKGCLEAITGKAFEQNFEVVFNPIHNNVHSLSVNSNHALSICSQSRHQTLAAECLGALVNDERICHAFYTGTGSLPVNSQLCEHSNYSSQFFIRFKQQLLHTSSVDTQHPMFTHAMTFCAHAAHTLLFEDADIEQELHQTEKYLRLLYGVPNNS